MMGKEALELDQPHSPPGEPEAAQAETPARKATSQPTPSPGKAGASSSRLSRILRRTLWNAFRPQRLVQVGVMVLLVVTATLNVYEATKVKYGGDTVIEDSVALSAIDDAIGEREDRTEITTALRGNLWSAEVFGFRITDPLAVTGVTATLHGIGWAFLISALVPILLTVLLGRVYCGWICPMGLFGEVVVWLRKMLERVGLGTLRAQLPPVTKYAVLIGGLAISAVVGVQIFAMIYPPQLVSGAIYAAVAGHAIGAGVGILAAILLAELLFGDRIWCRSVCPGGALFSLLSRVRILRVVKIPDRCTSCFACNKVCPQKLEPQRGILGGDCDNCGDCIAACPSKALGRRLSTSAGARLRAGNKPKATGQGSKVPASLILLVLAVLAGASPAYAHHIRGIPHYAYQEDYPETPTYEDELEVDGWTVRFSYFNVPGAKAIDLAVYISKEGEGGRRIPYKEAVTFRVYASHESPDDTHPYTTTPRQTNVHRVNWVYEEDGLYNLLISFKVRGETKIATFPFQMGKKSVNWAVIGGSAGAVLLLFFVVVLVRRRRDRDERIRESDCQ